MTETVNHPAHYNSHPSGVECIDVVEFFNFNIGNAIKYLWRVGLKSSNAIEDLQKAAWYCNREIERLQKPETKYYKIMGMSTGDCVGYALDKNDVSADCYCIEISTSEYLARNEKVE